MPSGQLRRWVRGPDTARPTILTDGVPADSRRRLRRLRHRHLSRPEGAMPTSGSNKRRPSSTAAPTSRRRTGTSDPTPTSAGMISSSPAHGCRVRPDRSTSSRGPRAGRGPGQGRLGGDRVGGRCDGRPTSLFRATARQRWSLPGPVVASPVTRARRAAVHPGLRLVVSTGKCSRTVVVPWPVWVLRVSASCRASHRPRPPGGSSGAGRR